jgi:hypothetical protein
MAVKSAAQSPVTLVQPTIAWDSEIQKRNLLFELGRDIGADWFLVVDADMEVVRAPFDLKDVLAGSDRAVGTYWLEDGEYGGRHPVRFLFRSAPDLRVVGRHYGYRLGDSLLWDTGGLPAVETDLVIRHFGHERTRERNALGDEYDRLRETHGIENDAAPAGVPA